MGEENDIGHASNDGNSGMNNAPRVLIIGAGVIGLTTALCLRRRGFPVTVIADRFSPDLTSNVAGALWEWPPAVCGSHEDPASLERSKRWASESYRIFSELAKDADSSRNTGVYLRPSAFYFFASLQPGHSAWTKMQELRARVRGFRHDPALIREHGVNPEYGVTDAYEYLSPMIDTDAYLPWLRRKLDETGCSFVRDRVEGDLSNTTSALKSRFACDFVVNCTGLGARELGDPAVYPMRGALVRIVNASLPEGRLQGAHCISHSESSEAQDIVFIVPRGEDRIVLGGLTEADQWDDKINLENYAPIREMLERCIRFLPRLKAAAIDPSEPVRAGLRPARRGSIRVEADPRDPTIFHCYGHGGAGVTLSWGSAREITEQLVKAVDGTLEARSA
jgi:D-amino-acid oxidase